MDEEPITASNSPLEGNEYGSTIKFADGRIERLDHQVTLDEIKALAARKDIYKFYVYDEEGNMLHAADFPRGGVVKIVRSDVAE